MSVDDLHNLDPTAMEPKSPPKPTSSLSPINATPTISLPTRPRSGSTNLSPASPTLTHFPPFHSVQPPTSQPPPDLRTLIENYAAHGGCSTSLSEQITAEAAWDVPALRTACRWVDYLTLVEIQKIRIRVLYRNNNYGAGIGDERVREMEEECREMSEGRRVVVQEGEVERARFVEMLVQGCVGACEVRVKVEVMCGV